MKKSGKGALALLSSTLWISRTVNLLSSSSLLMSPESVDGKPFHCSVGIYGTKQSFLYVFYSFSVIFWNVCCNDGLPIMSDCYVGCF